MKRFGIIALFVLLFVAFIWVWDVSYQSGLEEAYVPIETNTTEVLIPSETGVFKRSALGLDYLKMPIDETHQRSLKTYYNNRAFYGAPPSIPHPVVNERSMGGDVCLMCHKNGGFVAKFDAYAPVTPHPEMVNCRQCHVPKNSETLFKDTKFEKKIYASIGNNSAMEGSPPTIPHAIQMRENCLSCHAGPSAPKEIRTTHPDRVNCRQCHVPNETQQEGSMFSRKNKNE